MKLYLAVLADAPDVTEVVMGEKDSRDTMIYRRFGSTEIYRKEQFSSVDNFLELLADEVYRVNHNEGSTYDIKNKTNLIICDFAKTFGLSSCVGCGEKHDSGECEGVTDDPDSRWENETKR